MLTPSAVRSAGVWLGSALAMLAASALAAPSARAASLTLTSRTVYHGYSIRLFPGDEARTGVRSLNRFYETLDVGGWFLGPDEAFDATVSLRYTTDFGTGFHRDTPEGLGVPAVDERDEVDLLYAYVDWRDTIPGLMDLRLGRQLVIDDLDWYSFDGLKVTLRRDRLGAVELYVGRPVQFEALLSSESLTGDGTEVSDGSGLVFGGNLTFHPFEAWIVALAYRQELIFRGDDLEVFQSGALDQALVAAIREASGGKIGLQEHLFGVSAGYTFQPVDVDLYAHLTWNLLFGELDQARGGISWAPGDRLTVRGEYLRVRPRFLGDSIFNVFNIFPYDRARVEATWEIFDGLRVDAEYFVQVMGGGPKGPRSTDPSATAAVNRNEGKEFGGDDLNHGITAGVSYRADRWGAGVVFEAATNFGGAYAYGGNYRLAQAFGDVSFFEGRLTALLRLSYTGFQNDWFERIDTGAVDTEHRMGAVDVGLRGVIVDGVSARINFIKNFESYVEGSYRLLSVLEIRY